MNKSQKTKKPFALSFLKEIPEAELKDVLGGNNGNGNGGGNPNNQITTLAITTTSYGFVDVVFTDQV